MRVLIAFLFVTYTWSQNSIVFSLYTLHKGTLKITAQLDGSLANATDKVQLEILQGANWSQVAEVDIINPGWTAPLRVENWNMSQDVSYRIKHNSNFWTGTIRKDPVDKDTIIAAVLTGNTDKTNAGAGIPKTDIIDNIKKHAADILIFTGDQVYNHTQHYTNWLIFGRDFGELMRDIPTVTIPDDHDAGQANLWGSGGNYLNPCTGGDGGGYCQPAAYVMEVERAQTSHLPDPYDPTPIEQGIGVYYTHLLWGEVSFAILEDRKWKTGPREVISAADNANTGSSRFDHIRDPNFDMSIVDAPNAVLLGDRQLTFLEEWSKDWEGAEMKSTISQTIFGNIAHLMVAPVAG